MTVVPFPKDPPRPRPDQLPADARPIGRERCILIYPEIDGWTVEENDDGGAMILGARLSKEQALAIGLDWVRDCNANLFLYGVSYYESSGSGA